jgi:hypothetical protein
MIDPPWFKPAVPVLRLAATRDPLQSVLEFLRSHELRPLVLPALKGDANTNTMPTADG